MASDDDVTRTLTRRAESYVGNSQAASNLMGQALPDTLVYLDSGVASQKSKELQKQSAELEKKIKAEKDSGKRAALALQKQAVDQEILVHGKSLSYAEARLLPSQQWTDEQIKQFVNKGIAYKIDGFQPGMGLPEIQAAWDSLLQKSISLSAGATPTKGKIWTPDMILESYGKPGKFGTTTINGWVFDVGTGERIGYKGPLTKKTTQKNLNLSSAEDVQVLAAQALREALGRDPTAGELATFKATLNGLESSNPEITTTTTQLKPNLETGELETVAQDSTTSGGISDAAKVAALTEEAKEKPEFAKFQGGTTYFNALLAMAGGG